MQIVTLSLFRFPRWRDRFWVLTQMALAPWGVRRVPGLGFTRLCGSGTGEGFTPRPNTEVWAIFAVWDSAAAADAGLASAPVYRRWGARAAESCTFRLEPFSARGTWGGQAPLHPYGKAEGALAALTRATVRPRAALRFWGSVPDISLRIGADPNVAFKIGIGEVPLLHQVTFSVWPDAARMAAFARTGPHAAAIADVRKGDWFSEELYARFRVTGATGTWEGAHPLHKLETAA